MRNAGIKKKKKGTRKESLVFLRRGPRRSPPNLKLLQHQSIIPWLTPSFDNIHHKNHSSQFGERVQTKLPYCSLDIVLLAPHICFRTCFDMVVDALCFKILHTSGATVSIIHFDQQFCYFSFFNIWCYSSFFFPP